MPFEVIHRPDAVFLRSFFFKFFRALSTIPRPNLSIVLAIFENCAVVSPFAMINRLVFGQEWKFLKIVATLPKGSRIVP